MTIENYEKFLEVVDDDLRKIFDYQKEYLACKEGCAHCCKRGDFPMSELEFKYLMLGFLKFVWLCVILWLKIFTLTPLI